MVTGTIRLSASKVEPITSSDFDLAEFGEFGQLPSVHTFNVRCKFPFNFIKFQYKLTNLYQQIGTWFFTPTSPAKKHDKNLCRSFPGIKSCLCQIFGRPFKYRCTQPVVPISKKNKYTFAFIGKGSTIGSYFTQVQ